MFEPLLALYAILSVAFGLLVRRWGLQNGSRHSVAIRAAVVAAVIWPWFVLEAVFTYGKTKAGFRR